MYHYLPEKIDGHKINWQTNNNMDGWFADLPESVTVESYDDFGETYCFVTVEDEEFNVKTDSEGQRYITKSI